MELLKTLGCSDEMVRIAIVKLPGISRASEGNLRSTVEFLVNKVGLM
jgi:hypothetical protein